MTTNPIIPWLGDKRRLADKLLPLFPAHECYVELFCGGAALFFLRGQPASARFLMMSTVIWSICTEWFNIIWRSSCISSNGL